MYAESEDQAKTRTNNFMHHTPIDQTQIDRYTLNRNACSNVAALFNTNCKPSRELSVAQTKLEEAMFWANAAIARNE